MITAVLTKKDQSDWSDEELFPVLDIAYTDSQKCGGYGPITLTMRDGRVMTVDYEGLEGKLTI